MTRIEDGYIRIHLAERNRPIFRFMPLKHFLHFFLSKTNFLSAPGRWEDPWENIVANSRYKSCDYPFRHAIFGQCWTFADEHGSDAAWRMYTPNRDGVRIEMTPMSLLASLECSSVLETGFPTVTAFLGRVRYLKEEELTRILFSEDALRRRLWSRGDLGFARSFLLKRRGFAHEREVRLLVISPNDDDRRDYQYDCDPVVRMQSVLFDPRMDASLCDGLKRLLKKRGFKGDVRRSALYEMPEQKESVQQAARHVR
jgi:hypothetical protein